MDPLYSPKGFPDDSRRPESHGHHHHHHLSDYDAQRLRTLAVWSGFLADAMKELALIAASPQTISGAEASGKQQKQANERTDMSTPQDDLTQLQTNFPIIQQGIVDTGAAVAALDAQIVAFQNSPGTLPPADQARLDNLVTSSGALATSMKALVAAAQAAPTAPIAPVPPPAP